MPKLTASAVFVDFYGEKVLYSGEKGAIDIEVRNVGNGTARNIQAVVTPLSPMKGITLGDSATLTKLMSGNTMTLKIPVMASKEVSEGEIRMRIDIKEKWGFDLNPSLEVTIKTSR